MGQSGNVVFLELEPWEMEFLGKRCPGDWKAGFFTQDAEHVPIDQISEAEILSVFIHSQVDSALLSRMPNLKMVATRSTGFDHVDIHACRARGVVVSNVPSYGSNTVAEHAFALMLILSRKIIPAHNRTLRGDFSPAGLQGFDLMGKVLGVIGTGKIGRHVIRIARGFQMQVLAYDSYPDPALRDLLGFTYVMFDELIDRSDVITLHCPMTPENFHLIGRRSFEKMKRGTLLINTARGGLIDTDALLWALEEGIIAGAGLDTIEEEEAIREERELLSGKFDVEKLRGVVRNHVLLNRDDVVITPHIAFNSREAVERILQTTFDNIQGFRSGMPRNCVG